MSSVDYTIRWVDSSNSVATSLLTVKSEDSSGNPINGYYTVLSSGSGAVVQTGFTPVTFELDDGASFAVQVQDYGDYVFDHWKESGSTFRDQGITIYSDTTMTAVYRNISAPPPDGQSKISVKTVNEVGNEITGYYTTIWQGDQLLQQGFSPASFTVSAGQRYSVAVADYGNYYFDHWSDGSTARFLNIPVGAGETVALTAVYRTS
jgi:hypothetical protein